MVPKHPYDPPSSSEEEGSDSTASESESEPQTQKANKSADSDEEDDDSGSDSDSDSDVTLTKSLKAKLIAAKPILDLPKSSAKKPRSKQPVPASPAPPKSGSVSGAKRPAEEEPSEAKRAKKKKLHTASDDENGGKKTDDQKKPFQRLWSEEDEIVILKCIIDYVVQKGTDPVNDMNAFHDFIKKSLHIDVTKTQLQDKVRRLKRKFKNNASKVKPGIDRTFTKPHEQEAFDMSKKIWAPDGRLLGVESSKANGSAKKNSNAKGGKSAKVEGLSSPEVTKVPVESKARTGQQSGVKRNVQFWRNLGNPALEDGILNDGLELIEGPKRVELEEKWKKLGAEEVELYLKRVDLIREHTALVLDALKSGKN